MRERCRCGYCFDSEIPCVCPPHLVKSHFQKIAGPILDRIDIEVLVARVPYHDIISHQGNETSVEIKQRVMAARERQDVRFAGSATRYNSRMTQNEIRDHCRLSADAEAVLESAVKRTAITARSYFKVLKTARTIADLSGSERIGKGHVLEALSYKNLQKNYDI